ncbi:hypothetical protein PM082_016259 [Marasmius tenuissimus]|nr:hypothetical protein PM082_016259 [Marasmius tenuissimus]
MFTCPLPFFPWRSKAKPEATKTTEIRMSKPPCLPEVEGISYGSFGYLVNLFERYERGLFGVNGSTPSRMGSSSHQRTFLDELDFDLGSLAESHSDYHESPSTASSSSVSSYHTCSEDGQHPECEYLANTATPKSDQTHQTDPESILLSIALSELADIRSRREELRELVEREEREFGRRAYVIGLGVESTCEILPVTCGIEEQTEMILMNGNPRSRWDRFYKRLFKPSTHRKVKLIDSAIRPL